MSNTFATVTTSTTGPHVEDSTFSSQAAADTKSRAYSSISLRPSLADTFDITSGGPSAEDTQTLDPGTTDQKKSTSLTKKTAHQYRISGLSCWTGRVISVDGDTFSAELVPDEATGGATVVADFEVEQVVSEGETLHPGDVVYLTSRRVRASHGGKSETSSIRLRRLGVWTERDVEESKARAAMQLDELLGLID